MSSAKEILKIVPTLQSVALLKHNAKFLKKKKKKKMLGDMVALGTTNIVGTALIKEQADFIGSME